MKNQILILMLVMCCSYLSAQSSTESKVLYLLYEGGKKQQKFNIQEGMIQIYDFYYPLFAGRALSFRSVEGGKSTVPLSQLHQYPYVNIQYLDKLLYAPPPKAIEGNKIIPTPEPHITPEQKKQIDYFLSFEKIFIIEIHKDNILLNQVKLAGGLN